MANADININLTNATSEMITFEKYIIFPKFASYFPKLIIFTIIFAIIMTIIFRVSIAPAPLTPNFRMLYDIIFGSHANAQAKLDKHIRTAISLSNSTKPSHKKKYKKKRDTFVSTISVDDDVNDDANDDAENADDLGDINTYDTSVDNIWSIAATKWQNIGKTWINQIFANLFITGHSINVYAPV